MSWTSFARTHWDRISGWAAIVAGAIALLIGWQGVSTTPFPAEQLPYIISGGVGGVLLVGVGVTLLLSADMRDEWLKLDRIEELLRDDKGEVPSPDPVLTPAISGTNGATPKRSRGSARTAVGTALVEDPALRG